MQISELEVFTFKKAYSIPNVALYDTLGPETSEFILNHAEIPILICSIDKVQEMLSIAHKCPKLKSIIVLKSLFKENLDPMIAFKKWGEQVGVYVIEFDEIIERGKSQNRPLILPAPDDFYCISYTSGRRNY